MASGNTAAALAGAGIAHLQVADVTGSPEMLGGRVKTLHPKIHGGILADRDEPSHLADLEANGIEAIDLVVSNLYPFSSDPSIELIDIGGPSMVRGAAKNHAHVGIVTSPGRLPRGAGRAAAHGLALRRPPAAASPAPPSPTRRPTTPPSWPGSTPAGPGPVDGGRRRPRRRSVACWPRPPPHAGAHGACSATARTRTSAARATAPRVAPSWWDEVQQHGGKELSYLNLFDGDAAWRLVHELAGDAGQPAVAIIKHANPCGAAVADDLVTAYERALECDVQSAFGGVVAIGGVVTEALADAVAAGPQADVIIASSYEPAALEKLTDAAQGHPPPVGARPREAPCASCAAWVRACWCRTSTTSSCPRADWTVVTARPPTEDEWRDLVLAWRVCGRTTSNAIAIVNNGQAVGVGAGQQSRVVAAEIAVRKAGEAAKGGAGASDAFFPFPDGLLVLAAAGVTAVVQPGGSVKDGEVIAAADEAGSGHGGHRRAALPALMAAILLDGEAVAARVRAEVADRVARLAHEGIPSGLGTVLVGTDGPSERYVAMKHADCAEVGMVSVGEQLPETATQAEVEEVVRRFNADPAVHAYLVQLPLPDGPRRGAGPAGRRPGQGRGRAAPAQSGAAGDGRPGPAALHAGGNRRTAGRLRCTRGRSPRGDHRARPDHRSSALPSAGGQAAGLQRRGDRRAHRGGRPGRHRAHGRRGGGGGRAGRPGDPRHDQAGGGRGRGRDQLGGEEAALRRRTRTWPRWPGGSRPAWAGSAR